MSERRRFLTNAAIGGISALSMPLVLQKRLNLVTQARQESPVTPSLTGGHLRIIDVKSDVVQRARRKAEALCFLASRDCSRHSRNWRSGYGWRAPDRPPFPATRNQTGFAR